MTKTESLTEKYLVESHHKNQSTPHTVLEEMEEAIKYMDYHISHGVDLKTETNMDHVDTIINALSQFKEKLLEWSRVKDTYLLKDHDIDFSLLTTRMDGLNDKAKVFMFHIISESKKGVGNRFMIRDGACNIRPQNYVYSYGRDFAKAINSNVRIVEYLLDELESRDLIECEKVYFDESNNYRWDIFIKRDLYKTTQEMIDEKFSDFRV